MQAPRPYVRQPSVEHIRVSRTFRRAIVRSRAETYHAERHTAYRGAQFIAQSTVSSCPKNSLPPRVLYNTNIPECTSMVHFIERFPRHQAPDRRAWYHSGLPSYRIPYPILPSPSLRCSPLQLEARQRCLILYDARIDNGCGRPQLDALRPHRTSNHVPRPTSLHSMVCKSTGDILSLDV